MFGKIRHVDGVIQLMKPAPANKPKNWAAYRAHFVEPVRIKAGVEFWNTYAGAIGLAQFMPRSIRQYGVDFDGNGKIDLRNSPIDAIVSIANYLAKHGWKTGMPIVFPVTLSTDTSVKNRWQAFIGQGLEAKCSLNDLMAAGVLPGVVPPADMRFAT